MLSLVAVLLAIALSHPLWLAPIFERQLSQSSGRDVRVQRAWLTLDASLAPVLHARGIRIDNAPWADRSRRLAELDEAIAVFSWQSLEEGRPIVARLTLRQGSVDLERSADGLRNWRLKNPEDRGPGRYKILTLEADRASVRFKHDGVDLDLQATATPNTASTDLPNRVDVKGRWRGVDFDVRTETAAVLTLLETRQTFPLRGSMTTAAGTLRLDGRIGDLFRDQVVDADAALTASTLAPLAAWIGTRWPDPKAIQAKGHLQIDAGRYAVTALQARVGKTDLKGTARWTRRSAAKGSTGATVDADIASDFADTVDLRWLAGHVDRRDVDRTLAAAPPVSNAARRRDRAASAPRGPTDASAVAPAGGAAVQGAPAASAAASLVKQSQLHANVTLAIKRLHAAELPALQRASLKAALAEGRLSISDADVGLADGSVRGSITADLDAEPLRVDADLRANALRIESLAGPSIEKVQLRGALSGRVRLQASGRSTAALRRTLSGTVDATLANGTISSLVDAAMGLQGGRLLKSFLGGATPIPLRCGAATVAFDRGIGHVRSLVIESVRTRTLATGTIDVGTSTLDLTLTPEAKQSGWFILDRSIHLHGPWKHLDRSLVDRQAMPPTAACR